MDAEMKLRGEKRHSLTALLTELVIGGLLAAGCGPAASTAAPIPTDTAAIKPLAPLVAETPTAQPAATETLSPTSAPFILDFTPLPTETALPTVEIPTEAARPPAMEVWDGLPTYPAESNPDYYFRLSFDPNAWALTMNNYGMPALAHRAITNCVLSPAAGRGLPPNENVQHESRRINNIPYQISTVTDAGGVRQSVTYVGGDGRIYTGFQLSLEDRPDQCIAEAEVVLGTLSSVPVFQATPIATP
jgi:hypothetical protein